MRWIVITLMALGGVLKYGLATGSCAPELHLNQIFIQRQSLIPQAFNPTLVYGLVRSQLAMYFSKGASEGRSGNFDRHDPKQIFTHVFERLPTRATVYPTETYYYFYFERDHTEVAGNFRFVDATQGKLHIGFFDRRNPHSAFMGSATFGAEDGVTVEQRGQSVFVTYRGVTKVFDLNLTFLDPPQRLRMLPSEEFVARIFDESGFQFFLLFNQETDAFYYVTNDELRFPDRVVEGPTGYVLAPESGFVFYEDTEFARRILVGVHEKHIYMNSYFDGPFDQLPPRLQIRDKILRAYPYAAERGGIDEHGNFREVADTRVAISPYTNYRKLADLVSYQQRCLQRTGRAKFWSCLAYEWKRDFHRFRSTTEGSEGHLVYLSQGWPANHWADASASWPTTHQSEASRAWPMGHEGALSAQRIKKDFAAGESLVDKKGG